MKILITGAAGFIGSNLSDALLEAGHSVVGLDNFSTGREEFLKRSRAHKNFSLLTLDLTEAKALAEQFPAGTDFVFHLAANADVRDGLKHPRRDLEQNVLATHNLLEAMRAKGCKKIAFSSTGSIYGEPKVFPTAEDAPFPVQTSLYGASKLAAEGLIAAYGEGYGFQAKIFRFVSILGERYTHGHVFDFVKSLLKNPEELTVLGNGKQRKSYLYVQDCVRALCSFLTTDRPGTEIYNLGTNEYVEVDDSVAIICAELGVKPKILHTGGERGWVGDSPFIYLDCAKARATGWVPEKSIADSVRLTTRYLLENRWLFEEKKK